jgi:ABC-2 type transport system ATP-binding protein
LGERQGRRVLQVIEARGLTKKFGDRTAVRDVSFQIEKGEVVGFLGPNGAGKTTTLRMLTGYFPPNEGEARLDGRDVFAHPREVKKRIGYLPETLPLYPEMTVWSYLDFISRIKGVERKHRKSRIELAMERCSLADVRRRPIGNLSKGYRQRVGMAQAILHEPEVLFLDEPTSGLDPKQIIEIRELIRKLSGDHTLVLSTHILPEVTATCQRVIILNKGSLVAVDTIEGLTKKLSRSNVVTLQARDPDARLETVLGSIPGVRTVRRNDDGSLRVESEKDRDLRGDAAKAVVQAGYDLLEMKSERMSLEDVFLRLTMEEPSKEQVGTVGEAPGDAS